MTTEERIEAYILDTLSKDERTRLEEEMQSDPELANQVEIQRTLIYSVETLGLKQKLQAIAAKESIASNASIKPEAKVRSLIPRSLAIAASFLVLLAAGWWAFKGASSSAAGDIDDIFYADPGLPTKMGENDEFNFYDAMVDYKREE